MKRLLPAAVLSAVIALLAAACGDDGSPSGSAAVTVNGSSVSVSQIDDELDYLASEPNVAINLVGMPAPEDDAEDPDGNAEEAWRMNAASSLISVHVLTQVLDEVVESEDLDVTSDDNDEAAELVDSIGGEFDPATGQLEGGEGVADDMPDSLRGDLERMTAVQYALERSLTEASNGEVTDEDVAEAYEEQIASDDQFEEYACSSHVLVAFDEDPEPGGQPPEPTDEREQEVLSAAEDVVERLDDGEDFAEVAEEVSDDTGSATQGGSLGCNLPGQFVPEFEEALYDLEVGSYTEPIRTQFGYHVILLESLGPPELDEVADDLRASLEAEAGDIGTEFMEIIQSTAEEMDIEVNPRFGTWSSEEIRVIPPEGAEPAPMEPLPDEELDIDMDELLENMDIEDLMGDADLEEMLGDIDMDDIQEIQPPPDE